MNAIIMPAFGRTQEASACLSSIKLSSRVTDITDFCVYAVGDATVAESVNLKQVPYLAMEPFNKSEALNVGINSAIADGADIITILDCDMVVGALFLDAARMLWESDAVKFCYRVRNAGCNTSLDVISSPFSNYDKLPLAYEAWGTPCHNVGSPPKAAGLQPHGNSQLSIRAADLGSIRYDTRYIGRGFSDIDFNWQIAEKFGPAYRGMMAEEPMYNLIHIEHDHQSTWQNANNTANNLTLYKKKWGRYASQ